jgi:hypothetical protein
MPCPTNSPNQEKSANGSPSNRIESKRSTRRVCRRMSNESRQSISSRTLPCDNVESSDVANKETTDQVCTEEDERNVLLKASSASSGTIERRGRSRDTPKKKSSGIAQAYVDAAVSTRSVTLSTSSHGTSTSRRARRKEELAMEMAQPTVAEHHPRPRSNSNDGRHGSGSGSTRRVAESLSFSSRNNHVPSRDNRGKDPLSTSMHNGTHKRGTGGGSGSGGGAGFSSRCIKVLTGEQAPVRSNSHDALRSLGGGGGSSSSSSSNPRRVAQSSLSHSLHAPVLHREKSGAEDAPSPSPPPPPPTTTSSPLLTAPRRGRRNDMLSPSSHHRPPRLNSNSGSLHSQKSSPVSRRLQNRSGSSSGNLSNTSNSSCRSKGGANRSNIASMAVDAPVLTMDDFGHDSFAVNDEFAYDDDKDGGDDDDQHRHAFMKMSFDSISDWGVTVHQHVDWKKKKSESTTHETTVVNKKNSAKEGSQAFDPFSP